MSIIRDVRQCLANYVEPKSFLLDGRTLSRLMRKNRMTIEGLSRKTGITQKRIREVRESGLDDPNAVRDWVQAVTGRDPGRIVSQVVA